MNQYRTLSQILKLYVHPEVATRVSSGAIKGAALPLELRQFRVIWGEEAGQRTRLLVELNKEGKVVIRAKSTRPLRKGELVSLQDIDPNECFIVRPEYGGREAAYFLCQSFDFEHFMYFDFEPNLPDTLRDDLPEIEPRFPVADFVNARHFRKVVKPQEKLLLLAKSNWPPAPGYCPQVLLGLHRRPDAIGEKSFVDAVAASYSKDYWDERLAFWDQADFFPKRIRYVRRAVEGHFQRDYIASIYVIVPQFEGVLRDFLADQGPTVPRQFARLVKEFKTLILSRQVLMLSRDILNVLFDFLETGSFWRDSKRIGNPSEAVNRHGILHGDFAMFENEGLSLKYLALFDALAFLILHDKTVTGRI